MELLSAIYEKHGMVALFAVLIVVGIAQLFLRIIEFAWNILKHKQQVSDSSVKQLISEIAKTRLDLRRFYTALKMIAGKKWPAIREELMKDSDFEH